MTVSLEQALIVLEHRQQQMLAFQQQLFETVLDKFFTKQNISGNKGFICNADSSAKMAVSEERPVEGSIPFISDGKGEMGKLAGSEQDNILLNSHETVTVSDDKGKDSSLDKALSPESNEAPLNPPISEDKLQSELNYGLHDIGQESWKDAYPEKDWNSTVNQIVPDVIQNHREIKAYNESASYPISHVSLPDMGSRNDAHNFDGDSYEDEKNKSVESNGDQKPNAILLDADSPSYLISSSENLNEFDGNVSEEPNSDDLKSSDVHYHLVIPSGFSIQCEKYVLNKVILIVIWRYEDPRLFRGGG